MARFKKNQYIPPEAPLLYEDHGRPVSRRQFIRQGLMSGSATLLSGGAFSLFANPNQARAAVAPDLDALAADIGCVLGRSRRRAKRTLYQFRPGRRRQFCRLQCAGRPG